MSEDILKAIIQLLTIVAKEDDVTLDEKATVLNFLMENLSQNDANRYYRFFENIILEDDTSAEDQESQIDKICKRINNSQTNQQKIVIILKLMELIAADGTVSKRENELLYHISETLHINTKITDLIKGFVIYQERSKVISPNILIVDDGSHDVPDKCKHIVLPNLDGFIFILRIPELEVYFSKYVGEELIYLNGAPMKTNRVNVFSLGSVVKSQENNPLFYSDVISSFRTEEVKARISFVADNVGFKFRNGNIGLRNVNIEESGGKLIAIMGGSGAGKSTLLNVLNGNEKPSNGSVRINGIDIHNNKKQVEGVIGYVPQDDLLVEELTVFQNLFFAAKLCFKDKSDEDLTKLAEGTLESLGLSQARDLRVGSPLDKSISGGQRKRLNIGLELLREPSVLYVDEPTSGLSSRDSENIMDLLKELSLKGKMIFVVIHQPSEDIFKMFDKLILLDVGGYQIYYGNPVESISYFKEAVNMVDTKSSFNPELIFNIIESKVVNEYGNVTNQRKVLPEEWNDIFNKKINIDKVKELEDVPPRTLNIPGRIKQFLVFTKRDSLAKLSNKQYLLVNFLEAPLLALILSFIIYYVPEDADEYVFRKNVNIPVFFFMSVIVALFMGLTVSAEEIIRDRKILKRESFLNLSRLSYLGSKVFIMLFISAVQTLTFVIISSLILELKGMLWMMWLVLFSVSCLANIMGLNVSSAFKSAVTVYVLIPLLIIPQLILSGVVVNFDKLNPTISVEDKVPFIGDIMASRWAYEALAVSQFKNNKYYAPLFPDEKISFQSEFKNLYFIPKLQSELDFVNYHFEDPEKAEEVSYKLTTIRNEIMKELVSIGKDKFPQVEDLSINKFSPDLYANTTTFLENLRSFYNLKAKKAEQRKSETLKKLYPGEYRLAQAQKVRDIYENDAVSVFVKNLAIENRVIEQDNELIQKIYPIYLDPKFPSHTLDYRAQFYAPTKHLFGRFWNTEYFNILTIWSMSIFFIIALYFDWLRKIVSGFSRK